jgi:uncharacterized protein YwgA
MQLSKNQLLLAYLCSKHGNASITVLMKLAYLVDLVNIKENKKQIFDFKYVRFYYGPYDSNINTDLENLLQECVISAITEYTNSGNEFIVYHFNDDKTSHFNELDKSELVLIDKVLEGLKGYGAKTLTDIAYKTAPLVKLGATQGGKEHLGEILDLNL